LSLSLGERIVVVAIALWLIWLVSGRSSGTTIFGIEPGSESLGRKERAIEGR